MRPDRSPVEARKRGRIQSGPFKRRRCVALFACVTISSELLQAGTPGGQAVGWGSTFLPYMEPGTRFTKIAAGGFQSLALRPDGTLVAWGRNVEGQSNVPA